MTREDAYSIANVFVGNLYSFNGKDFVTMRGNISIRSILIDKIYDDFEKQLEDMKREHEEQCKNRMLQEQEL